MKPIKGFAYLVNESHSKMLKNNITLLWCNHNQLRAQLRNQHPLALHRRLLLSLNDGRRMRSFTLRRLTCVGSLT